MKIDPQIKRRFMRSAALEQLRHDLEGEGYVVTPDDEHGVDLVARRLGEVLAFEVKVLGHASDRPLTAASERARAIGASLRLVMVRSDEVIPVKIDGFEESLLEAVRRAALAWRDEEGSNDLWSVHSIDDIVIERVSVRLPQVDVEGTAAARLQMRSDAERVRRFLDGEPMAMLLRFRVSLDANRRVLDGAVVEPVDD